MKRLSAIVFVLLLSNPIYADSASGDVNFSLEYSPDEHPYKFRLIIEGTEVTFPTPCIGPDTGLAQTLSYGSIGQSSTRVTIQAADCTHAPDQWSTLNGYIDYDSNSWYDVYIDMVTHSFHH